MKRPTVLEDAYADYRDRLRADMASPADCELVLQFLSPSATGKLVLVRDILDHMVWLPCALIRDRKPEGGVCRVTVPEWWAQKNSLQFRKG